MEQSMKYVKDESMLRKMIVEVHGHDVGEFDTESLLATIEAILTHVDTTNNPDEPDKLDKIINTTPRTRPILLHKITCLLNCECERDTEATALEILKLVANYSWEAKIVIILASFVLEYAQFHLLANLSKSKINPLANIVATLKQIPDVHISTDHIKSKFQTIVRLLNVSIQVTRLIVNFGCLPWKYISKEAEPVALALGQIPVAVYWITRLVIACASEFTGILGFDENKSSNLETLNLTSLEQKITTIHTNFSAQLELCNLYIELAVENKLIQYIHKLKYLFSEKNVHVDNQKILQTLLVRMKDGSHRPLSGGPDGSLELGVEALKGKTVLLLISNLEISNEEITKLSDIYEKSRKKTELQYEIVWLPIVETNESDEQKFEELKKKMPWYSLVKQSLVKRGVARYAKEEWKYSKQSIMVALDKRGKVVNPNAFHMVWTWGNEAYPFTLRRESDLWNQKTWSLGLLVDESSHHEILSEDQVICLYGGEKQEWIKELLEIITKQINTETKISVRMEYVGNNMSAERITKIGEIVSGYGSVCWETTKCTHFWRRIESMMYSKVRTAKEDAADPILGELVNMLTLRDCDQGWALISQGKGEKIARAKGDVIMKALKEFEIWSTEIEKKSFVVALHDYLANCKAKEHSCNRLILSGMDDILEIVVCAECRRPMNKYVMYCCCGTE